MMAGRHPYKITQKDFSAARRYIENAMLREEISKADDYMGFHNAHTPELLQTWCDNYLPANIFTKLKRAVLAARKRSRDYKTTRTKVGIDLEHLAHLRLSSLAKEIDKSLSETILLLEETYWLAKDNNLIK